MKSLVKSIRGGGSTLVCLRCSDCGEDFWVARSAGRQRCGTCHSLHREIWMEVPRANWQPKMNARSVQA